MMERKMAAEKNVPSPGSPVDFWDGLYKAGTMPWDAGASPRRLTRFLEEFSPECASRKSIRVLVPGCGSAYEAAYLASQGYEVEAIDFSEEAIKRAKVLFKDEKVSFEQADFFEFDGGPFDLIYERAFLCSFNPKLRQRFVRKLRSLLRPGGKVFGFFYIAPEKESGPPYPLLFESLRQLMEPQFTLEEDEVHQEQLKVFEGGERWQVWGLN